MELTDSRSADDWQNHFECLNHNGIEAIYLVSDDAHCLIKNHTISPSSLIIM
jgi:hypothetical protein